MQKVDMYIYINGWMERESDREGRHMNKYICVYIQYVYG